MSHAPRYLQNITRTCSQQIRNHSEKEQQSYKCVNRTARYLRHITRSHTCPVATVCGVSATGFWKHRRGRKSVSPANRNLRNVTRSDTCRPRGVTLAFNRITTRDCHSWNEIKTHN